MQQIQVADDLYTDAQRRAADAGFANVDEYITEVVRRHLRDESGGFDSLFTADRLAHLDQIASEIEAGGKTYTVEELNEHFEQKRKSWLDKDAG